MTWDMSIPSDALTAAPTTCLQSYIFIPISYQSYETLLFGRQMLLNLRTITNGHGTSTLKACSWKQIFSKCLVPSNILTSIFPSQQIATFCKNIVSTFPFFFS